MADSCDQSNLSRTAQLALAVSVLLLAGGLVDPDELVRSLVLDERVTYWVVSPDSPGSFWQRATAYSATPPGYMAVVRMLGPGIGLLPAAPWGMRLVSIACFVWLGLAVSGWCARRAGWLAGFIAAALVLSHPLVLQQAHLARPYLLGAVAAWYAMVLTFRIAEDDRSRWTILGWIAANAFALWSHYLFGLIWAVESAVLLHGVWRRRLPVSEFIALHAALLLVAVPLLPAMMRLWVRRQYLNWAAVPGGWGTLGELLLGQYLASWRAGWMGRAVCVGAAAVLVLGAVGRRWSTPRVTRGSVGSGWLALLIAGGLPILVLWTAGHAGMPSLATPRYTLPFIVLVLVAVGMAAARMLPRAAQAALLVSLLLVQPASERYVRSVPAKLVRYCLGLPDRAVTYEPVGAAWDEAAAFVAGRAREGDYLLVSSGLAEMSLVMVFPEDSLLHDYVSCRVMRRPGQRDRCHRLAVPLEWTDPLADYYARRFRAAVRARKEGGVPPDRYPRIFLVAATDTDRLQRLATITDELIRGWGWQPVESRRGPGVQTTVYALGVARTGRGRLDRMRAVRSLSAASKPLD